MNLPTICDSSKKLRISYLTLINYMAGIDGQLDNKEISLLRNMIQKFSLSEQDSKKIFIEQKFSKNQIDKIFSHIKKDNLHYSFILDLIAMASADGVILQPEKLMLAQISGLIGLTNDEFYNLINFSQATSNIKLDGCIDPMYQYVITLFFDWVKNKKVILFQETTLAIDDKVDAFLKNDL
jgi:uncharacterized tellurite resistance protein B-like protein